MEAGNLDHRFTFASRGTVDDGYGNEESGPFEDRFTVWAGVTYLRGSEAVMASRLEGRQPIVIAVRQSGNTQRITTDWKARNARTGEIFNINTIVPTKDRSGFEITATSGVAV